MRLHLLIHSEGFGYSPLLGSRTRSLGHSNPCSMSGSSLLGLAEKWEDIPELRSLVREHKSLLVWPNKKCTGVISMKACALNHILLHTAAQMWVPNAGKKPKTFPVDFVKHEALP